MSAPLVLPARFDPAQTLDCGQAFRWREVPDNRGVPWWEGIAGGRFLRLRREGNALLLSCSQQEFDGFWRNYFDWDEDYSEKLTALSALSPVLRDAAAFAPGIRILRQDPWEALCSFLISQNNNIPRIKRIIEDLCSRWGKPIPGCGLSSFPTPEALATLSLQELAPLRAGYRAQYLLDAARKTASGEIRLREMKDSPAAYGREELRKVLGVGPKVAECVLLYGFHKTECFPMDVWMKRAMPVLLPGLFPEDFGENAGLAQQIIFHYSRMHPALFQTADAVSRIVG